MYALWTHARVSKGTPLYFENGKIKVDQTRYFGCIGYGHHVSICPARSITFEGRDAPQNSFVDIPSKEIQAGYKELMALMFSRRRIRI